MDAELEGVEPHKTTEGDPELTPEPEKVEDEAGLSPEEIETLKKRAEVSSQNFERAQKAEAQVKTLKQQLAEKSQAPQEQKDELSQKDLIFLAKADIHEDDLDDVLEWARFKKTTVQDAYKNLKATLDVRQEERKTAQATHTKKSAPAPSKVSEAALLDKFDRTGEVPEGEEGMQALFRARLARKLGKQ